MTSLSTFFPHFLISSHNLEPKWCKFVANVALNRQNKLWDNVDGEGF